MPGRTGRPSPREALEHGRDEHALGAASAHVRVGGGLVARVTRSPIFGERLLVAAGCPGVGDAAAVGISGWKARPGLVVEASFAGGAEVRAAASPQRPGQDRPLARGAAKHVARRETPATLDRVTGVLDARAARRAARSQRSTIGARSETARRRATRARRRGSPSGRRGERALLVASGRTRRVRRDPGAGACQARSLLDGLRARGAVRSSLRLRSGRPASSSASSQEAPRSRAAAGRSGSVIRSRA